MASVVEPTTRKWLTAGMVKSGATDDVDDEVDELWDDDTDELTDELEELTELAEKYCPASAKRYSLSMPARSATNAPASRAAIPRVIGVLNVMRMGRSTPFCLAAW